EDELGQVERAGRKAALELPAAIAGIIGAGRKLSLLHVVNRNPHDTGEAAPDLRRTYRYLKVDLVQREGHVADRNCPGAVSPQRRSKGLLQQRSGHSDLIDHEVDADIGLLAGEEYRHGGIDAEGERSAGLGLDQQARQRYRNVQIDGI